jgi:hypothetical protein
MSRMLRLILLVGLNEMGKIEIEILAVRDIDWKIALKLIRIRCGLRVRPECILNIGERQVVTMDTHDP